MRQVTVRTNLDVFIVSESTAAFVSQQIQWAVAKQTVESIFIVRNRMAGEVFAFAVAEKFVAVVHNRAIILSIVLQLRNIDIDTSSPICQ